MASPFKETISKTYSVNIQTFQDDLKARKDKEFFKYSGTQIYCGRQGQGKTISAIHNLRKLKKRYPKALIVTNLDLKELVSIPATVDVLEKTDTDEFRKLNIDHYIRFDTFEELSLALTMANNSKYGVIYLIDEIHTYLNATDSKNVPMYIFTEISQQRKQRKLIMGTSQLFTRNSIALREQCDHVMLCRTYMGVFTYITVYDGESIQKSMNGKQAATKIKSGFFIQTRKDREYYDTFQKVVSGYDQMIEMHNPIEIQNNSILKKNKRKLGFSNQTVTIQQK